MRWQNLRQIVIAGATGLVGHELLRRLLADKTVSQVHALARRKREFRHPKLTFHLVDFASLAPLPPVDEVYLATGTTIKVAGSQAAFRAVDFDANLAVARAAFATGATRAGLVSAMGADPKSRVFYSRVKGELELAVAELGFKGLVIARPSLLLGNRAALGQPTRPGERIGAALGGLFGRLVPADYRAIAAADVAHALLSTVPSAVGKTVLSSGAMNRGQ